MAEIPYLVAINLNGNELRAAVIQVLATDPGSPAQGQIWFNSVSGHIKYCSNAAGPVILDVTDALLLNGQAPSFYLARGNHTGTQLAATISDFDGQVRLSRLDQMAAPTADVSLNSHKITNLQDPTGSADATTKSYVDALFTQRDWKQSVRAASTGALTLSATQTVDGVALIAGDRVLVKDQGTASQNGIYVVAAGAWARATDADQDAEVTSGMNVPVEEGTANGGHLYFLTTPNPITVGTTGLTFAPVPGGTSYTAGTGITVTGSVISINTGYVGQASITTLGTITTGVWTGTQIAVANGGTGATTAAGARTNLGVAQKGYAQDVGGSTSQTITHNLGTKDVIVELFDNTTPFSRVEADVQHATTNTIILAFTTAPSAAKYRVVIIPVA